MVQTDLQRNERLVREQIARNMAAHVVTAVRIDGLYRHYRCQTPKTWNFGFDIVTWPGWLAFTGDLGEFLFSRETDMIPFMAALCRSRPIDYRYAAEKCRASRGDVREFSERKFKAALCDVLRERRHEKKTVSRTDSHLSWLKTASDEPTTKDKIRAIRDEWEEYHDPDGAIRAMHESGLWDACDPPSCQTFTHQFVLCVNCIDWFCEKLKVNEVVIATEVAA